MVGWVAFEMAWHLATNCVQVLDGVVLTSKNSTRGDIANVAEELPQIALAVSALLGRDHKILGR
jgi:hypothetical protein